MKQRLYFRGYSDGCEVFSMGSTVIETALDLNDETERKEAAKALALNFGFSRLIIDRWENDAVTN